MPKVEIKNQKILLGKKEIPLISGEVHYWRLNANAWRDVLKSVKDMGVRIISTYVPWDFHEYKRGSFDFTGKTDPARNLKAFLDLTRKEGFYLILRPGPYIYGEWQRDGVPQYAYKYHRLHPQFLTYAQKWIKEVSKIFLPYLATRANGHILMVQADNEIDPWPDLFGNQYGLSGQPGLFQEFIETVYNGRVNDLNAAWGTNYKSFDEAAPFIATMLPGETGLPLKGDKELKRHLDYFMFKYFYSRQVARKMVEMYRAVGVDVPVYLNAYPFFYAQDWADLQAESDAVGIDMYPTNEFSEDEFEQRKFCDKIRYLSSVSNLPFIAEFQSGVWHGHHYKTKVLTPNHYRLISSSALMAGICGWNWYMLVNRDNWYMSPINEWGRVRDELFDVFKQIVAVFNQFNPSSVKKLTDVAVTINPIQYAARTFLSDSPVLSALYDADIDYDAFDPSRSMTNKKVVFYSGNQWLGKDAHQNLRKYVERGGSLVAFRSFPRKDDDFKTCREIGFEDPDRTLFEFKRSFKITFGKKNKPVQLVSSVYTFAKCAGEKITADFGNYGKQTIGYIKKIGKGKIIHLGIEPSAEVALAILDYLKIFTPSRSLAANVKTALFSRRKKYFLVVTNNGVEAKTASINLRSVLPINTRVSLTDLATSEKQKVFLSEECVVAISIGAKDGKVFEIARS